MSIWDWIRNRVRPTPAPRPKPTPVTPPGPPPIDPEYAKRRAEAMNRRAVDGLRYKKYQSEAMSTGFLPPAPPSVDWYMAHPDYVWDPHQPNPEKPVQPPKPIPQPTPIPKEDEALVKARERWSRDMKVYNNTPKNSFRPLPHPPSLKYYLQNPDYIYNPKAPQVR